MDLNELEMKTNSKYSMKNVTHCLIKILDTNIRWYFKQYNASLNGNYVNVKIYLAFNYYKLLQTKLKRVFTTKTRIE